MMINNSKKLFLILLLICTGFVFVPVAQASPEMKMDIYYPSLVGEYDTFRLLPRADLTAACPIGSLYVNSLGSLQYCHNDGSGNGAWEALSDVWMQTNDDIYLKDTLSNPLLRVGIGTNTPDSKLTLIKDGGIMAKGTFGSGATLPNLGAGSRFIWYPRKAAIRAGYVDGAQWDNGNIGNYSTAFGKNTRASGHYSAIGGGDGNIASALYSVVGSGFRNTASADFSAVGGGKDNMASGRYAALWGGENNVASGDFSAILGGLDNQATAIYSVVAGGAQNRVTIPYSNINGGFNNLIDFTDFGVPTGYSLIGGGKDNKVRSDYSIVLGGEGNIVEGPYSSIGGGLANKTGEYVSVFSPAGEYVRISGGDSNSILTGNRYSFISSGRTNVIRGGFGQIIGGGWQNDASYNYSVIAGGERNRAYGGYSTIMGGTDNIVDGDYSWAGGRFMNLTSTAQRTFAWGYSDTAVSIVVPDAFIIAPGTIGGVVWNPRVGIRDTNPVGVLEVNANGTADNFLALGKITSGDVFIVKRNGYIGSQKIMPTNPTYAMEFGNGAYVSSGGSWENGSSRKLKENIIPLTGADAQQAFEQLNPVTFEYKNDPDHTNIGFIAEDVPSLVAVKDRKTLSTMDIVAVLTKVVQNQQSEIEQREHKIQLIEERIKVLRTRLEK